MQYSKAATSAGVEGEKNWSISCCFRMQQFIRKAHLPQQFSLKTPVVSMGEKVNNRHKNLWEVVVYVCSHVSEEVCVCVCESKKCESAK